MRSPHSLRGRLLWFLLAAILLTAAVQTLVTYRAARAEADEIFDFQMQQIAMSLRAGLPASAATGEAPSDDAESADFVVQVWAADGRLVFRSTARSVLPAPTTIGFSNVHAHGATYRMFSTRSRSQTLQVAQDLSARREMAGTLALATVGPIAVMAPLLMLLVWWVVSASLAPVSRVQHQVAARQADELTEVDATGLPDEIRPLVQELNLLLGRVRQAFDAQTSFVADAAHELRSPLAALKLQAQGLQRAADDATREVAVGRLTAGIDRASRLVEQLLVLARQQASAATARTQPVALAQIARLALVDAAPSAQARRIDLGLGHADEDEISGYPDALRILLRNLLDNAIKYTPPGGVVDVELRRVGDSLVLGVDDSGPGIAEPDRERVLDRFHRLAGTQATGSGLGLAIVKSIAELHGATLSLDRSQRLGGLGVRVSFRCMHRGQATV